MFESNLPRILADFSQLGGFNEETKAKLKEYLQRAQQTNFLEKIDELTTQSAPKAKDLVVDETNLDIVIGKLADFAGTSPKKNLNEQLKRLEETEFFRAYLETKPKPGPPVVEVAAPAVVVEAPEVKLLVEEKGKSEALESALQSLQRLYVQTSQQLQAVWEHKQDELTALQTARKEFLEGVKKLPPVAQTSVTDALQETDKGLLVDLSQAGRPQAEKLTNLVAELEEVRGKLKSQEDQHQKSVEEHSKLLGEAQKELEQVKESLAQEKSKADEDKRQLVDQEQKLQEAEQKLKLAEAASKQSADQSEVAAKLETQKKAAEEALQKVEAELKEATARIETLTESATKVASLEVELDGLRHKNSDLSEKLATEQGTVKDLTSKITTAETSLSKQTSEIEELRTEIIALKEKLTQLEAANAELKTSAANNEESLKQITELKQEFEAKKTEMDQLKNANTKLVEDHNTELKGLQEAIEPLKKQIANLSQEMTRISGENERLTSELGQERQRSSTLTASMLSAQTDKQPAELEEAVVPPNAKSQDEPQQTVQQVAAAPVLSQPQPSQEVSVDHDSEPAAREGDIADQHPIDAQPTVDLTVEVGRLQEQIRLKESQVTAVNEQLVETKTRLNSVEAEVSNLRSEKDDLSIKVKDLETSLQNSKTRVSDITSQLHSASQAQEKFKSQLESRAQTDTTQKESESAAQLDAAKAAHTEDVKRLTDARVSVETQLEHLKSEFEKLGLEKTKWETQLSQEQEAVRRLTQELSEIAAKNSTSPLKSHPDQTPVDDEGISEHQQSQTSSPRKIHKLEHRIKQLEDERETYKKGQEEQAKVVQEKDEGLERIRACLEQAHLRIAEHQKKYDAVNKAYEVEKEKHQALKVKYDDLKMKYGHKSSGASTPGYHLATSDVRSSRQSVGPRIDEAVEVDLDVSDQAQKDLNEAAQSQVAQPENPGISAPFDMQKELAEKLLTKLQKCLKTLAISKEDSKLYLAVTADERSSLDTLMLEISKHWQSQTPQVPQEEAAPEEQMTEEAQQPETIANVFDTLREDNEMLTEQKQSLSVAVEQLLNPLKPLIVKVLGKQGLQPLGECCTVAAMAEEIGNILKGDFSTKLDELIASQSALKHESERLQKELAQNQKELVQSQKKASEQETKLQENKGPAEKLRKLVQLLSESRKTFRDQNPLAILEKAAGIAETTQVSVDAWKGGMATGVAHVIKDLLRRILTLVPQLHTANPKRNAPWINNLLDVMEGVSQETDKLVDGFRQQAQTKGLDEFLGALQEVVCRGGLPTN